MHPACWMTCTDTCWLYVFFHRSARAILHAECAWNLMSTGVSHPAWWVWWAFAQKIC